MRRLRTGLSRRGGKCAGKRLGISRIRFGLVFRGLDEKCAHNRNEISALAGELVFRQVPGKSVQGWGRAERFGVGVLVALLEAIGDGVGGIAGDLPLADPGRTTGGRSGRASCGHLACRSIVSGWGGSVLASRGGSVFASAEALETLWSRVSSTFSPKALRTAFT